MNKISIVVGTYNRLEYLKVCIESVIRETNSSFCLYITDAGSTDGTIEYLESIASDRIRPIYLGKKVGQAKAYNEVFSCIDTPYVCWISDDNEIINKGLDVAAEILDADKNVGMVALKVRDVKGPFVDAPYIGGVSSLGILNVNQGMLPTYVLKEVGYFSEAFRDYGIDPDLTAKVLMHGFDIVYTRIVAIHHYRLWEVDKSKKAYWDLRKRQECAVEFYNTKYAKTLKYGPVSGTIKLIWYIVRKILGDRYSINGDTPFLGLLPRDWHNVIASRFISLSDPIRNRGKKFHLRQHPPLWLRLKKMPADPDVAPEIS